MEDKLTKEDKMRFESLSRELTPPAELEEKIIQELKEKKLIIKSMNTNTKRFWLSGIAASILFFIGGYILGSSDIEGQTEITSGYILLLHEDERFQPEGSEIEMFSEYAAWMGKMLLNGINITGKELAPESTAWVSPDNRMKNAKRNDKISGYFIIDVEDRQEAERIAMSSPHIKHGGTVELIRLSERN